MVDPKPKCRVTAVSYTHLDVYKRQLQVDPYKVYFTESKFGIDLEGLFVAGAYNNQARIATVGFPWIKLDLDPMGSKMRNETHHTIYEAGFGYFINVVSHFKSKYGDKFSDCLLYTSRCV